MLAGPRRRGGSARRRVGFGDGGPAEWAAGGGPERGVNALITVAVDVEG